MSKHSTIAKKILFHNEDVKYKLKDKQKIRDWMADIIIEHDYDVEEINFIFVSDEYILQKNVALLNHDYYTDIITCPFHDEGTKKIFADVFISVERVADNAKQANISETDELHRVMMHGILHILGYNDHSEADKAEMRRQEEIALQRRNFETMEQSSS